MSDWKKMMLKIPAACLSIMAIGVATLFVVGTIHAQDTETRQGQEGYDFIVDEALDQIEEDLALAPKESGLSAASGEDDVVEMEVNISALKGPDETLETRSILLLHADASGLIKTLNQIKSPAGEIAYNQDKRVLIIKDESEQLEAMDDFVRKVDIPIKTKVFQLRYVKAHDILSDIKEILTEDVGRARFGTQANSIMVTDTPEKLEEINGLIKRMDRTIRDILFETRILQVVLNDEHPMGIDWEAIVSDYQKLVFPGFSIDVAGEDSEQLSLGTVSQEDYDVLVEALDTVGIVRTISQGNAKTESETARTLSIVPSLARDTRQDRSIPDAFKTTDSADSSTERWKSKEVQFHLTPTIKYDETLTVSVTPELVQGSAGALLTVPESEKDKDAGSSSRSIMVQVEDGATVVIGSLFEEVITESARKIPLLGDLPLLGTVFRNQEEELRKAEIIAFLTVKSVEKE